MPELPEVETIKRQLNEEIVGRTISEVWYDRAKMLRPSPVVFIKGVKGKKIVEVRRRAKLLIFALNQGFLVCHLRLSGRLLIRQKDSPPDDYVHVIFRLKAKSQEPRAMELRFAEARLFGYMQHVEDEEALDKILNKFGPEPLDDLNADDFFEILRRTSRPIKLVLLDQGRIAGVGNIYANDALFLAKIHPQTSAKSLTREQSDSLLKAIETVFKEGLKYGGASDQWYRQIHGEEGKYQEHFKAYGRAGERCDVCGGVIKRITLGGRGTFYCSGCQHR